MQPRRVPRIRSVSLVAPCLAAIAVALSLGPAGLEAQGLKLAVGDVGLGIGPVPRIDGLRINFRDDDRFERVRGINATIWMPEDDARGHVTGLALGLPVTGAASIRGIALGAGVGVHEELRGIGVAPLGIGVGGQVQGIAVGGIGAGAGNSFHGIGVGGLGIGAGNDISGIAIGGVGVGAGNSLSGLAVSLGGVGAGSRITGVTVAGLGIGAGNHLKWVALAGLGVGAPRITGVAAALGVGGEAVEGVVLAPAYFRLEEGGRLRGVSVSAFNDVRGAQHGLVIGLLNIAEELHGVQIGVINIARNKDRFAVLPLLNYHP
ncbi:MAG TPA: hypothetical protein VMM12_11395 [Longimicrobiales bacterium]|nr:hypothetical protein [Longimicrobiales bacterium]